MSQSSSGTATITFTDGTKVTGTLADLVSQFENANATMSAMVPNLSSAAGQFHAGANTIHGYRNTLMSLLPGILNAAGTDDVGQHLRKVIGQAWDVVSQAHLQAADSYTAMGTRSDKTVSLLNEMENRNVGIIRQLQRDL